MKIGTGSYQLIRSFWVAVVFALTLVGCGSGAHTSNTSNTGGGSGGGTGSLDGAWRDNALLTTWCISGTSGLITTDSNNGVPGQQFTGLSQMTFNGTSMSYYITWAAVSSNGTWLYNNTVYQGPNTQSYTLDPSATFFTAGNGTYTKIASTCSAASIPPTSPPPTVGGGAGGGAGGGGTTTGQVSVYTTRATTPTGSISVSIDNAAAGTITTYFTGTPVCGQAGTLTLTVAAGTHALSAVSGTLTWPSTTFSVTAGGCSLFALN